MARFWQMRALLAYGRCVRFSLASRPCFLTLCFLDRADRLSREAGERARVAEIMGASAPPPSRAQHLVSDDYRFSTPLPLFSQHGNEASYMVALKVWRVATRSSRLVLPLSTLLHSYVYVAQVWLQLRVCKLPWRPHS